MYRHNLTLFVKISEEQIISIEQLIIENLIIIKE